MYPSIPRPQSVPESARRFGRRALVLAFLVVLACGTAVGFADEVPDNEAPGGEPEGVLVSASSWQVVPGEVIVKFFSSVTQLEIDTVIDDCDTVVKVEGNTMLDATASAPSLDPVLYAALEALTRNLFWLELTGGQSVDDAIACFLAQPALVEFAEPNIQSGPSVHQRHPDDTHYKEQWGLFNYGQRDPPGVGGFSDFGTIDADVDAVQAWDLPHTDCSGVVVAILDTGADLDHMDLKANLWANPNDAIDGQDNDGNGYVDDHHGFDFIDIQQLQNPLRYVDGNNDGPEDRTPVGQQFAGHGTQVAGVIGAVGNNTRDIAGICWKAKLMIMRIGRPIFDYGAILFATQYVALQKAAGVNVRIINLSDAVQRQYALAKRVTDITTTANILFVVAAGNDGWDVDNLPAATPMVPCSYANPNVVCVAATTNQDVLASFSNWGTTSVDLAAPGTRILTLDLQNKVTRNQAGNLEGVDGTSYAAPHVAGVAALALSLFPTKSILDVKTDMMTGSNGPPAASGVDRVKTNVAASAWNKTVTGGRLRWPYTADLGDAPNTYDTIASGTGGALHWDNGNELFGRDVTPEADATTPPPLDQDAVANIVPNPNHDGADEPIVPGNGVFSFVPPPPWAAGALVAVSYNVCSDHFGIRDKDGGRFQSVKDRALYVNGWFDLSRNGAFEAGELLLTDVLSPTTGAVAPPAMPGIPNVTTHSWAILPAPPGAPNPVFPPVQNCVTVRSNFTVPAPGGTPKWVRFRLDWGEHVGFNHMGANPNQLMLPDVNVPIALHKGWGRSGEVEDFDFKEVDPMPTTTAQVTLATAFGPSQLTLSGPASVVVDLLTLEDSDGDGLEEHPSEMVLLELTGEDPVLGTVNLRLRDPSKSPFQRSEGRIEENVNANPGTLDLPPFAATGTAQSTFDVYFEVELEDFGITLHNEEPKEMETTITCKPPCRRDPPYTDPDPVVLYDEQGAPTGVSVEETYHDPDPPDGDPPRYCHNGNTIVDISTPSGPGTIKDLCHNLRPGKTLPPQFNFPAVADLECMESDLDFVLEVLNEGTGETLSEEISLSGPVCIQRGAPYTNNNGLRAIDSQMVMLDMTGTSALAGDLAVTLAPGTTSPGQLTQSPAAADLEIDISPVLPAHSWFDVTFVVEGDFGTSEPVGPLRVEADVISVPPGRLVDTEVFPPQDEEPAEIE